MDRVKESHFGVNVSGTLVNNSRFASDIDLIDEECGSVQQQFELTRNAAEEPGLTVNEGKMKKMVFGERHIEKIRLPITTIENLDKFDYLGSVIT